MRRIGAIFLFLLTGSIVIISCKKNPTWDTNILAPIINASMSVNDLVKGTSVKTNPDSSVTIVFSDSLYTLNMDSLLKIPDTSISNGLVMPLTTTINPGSTIYPTQTTNTNYGVSSVQLKEAIIQSGFVKIEAMSTVPGKTDFTYSVPGATLAGNPLNISIQVPAGTGSNPGDTIIIRQLNNYKIDFTGPSHNSYNLLSTTISGILDPSDNPTVVNAGDSIHIKTTFYSIIPYYGQGYFGEITKSVGPSTSAFSLFNKFTSGTLSLQDIAVTFTLENGLGVDARATISQLTSINPRTGPPVSLLDATLINRAIDINAATQTYNPASPVTPTIQTFSIVPASSNILNWIDNLPTSIGYGLQITTNPLGNVSGSNNFAFNGYGIKAFFNISVPLALVANNLTLADTVQVSFGNTANLKQLKSGTFTMYATNGFPFSAGMQIYLLDNTTHAIVDSLINPAQSIAAGTTNSNGIVISPQNSTLTIPLDAYHTQLLFNTKTIVIMPRFNMNCPTCIPPYGKIYDYNHLTIKLVGNFDYQVKG
ncbi:MAG TPA: hypothetical protein VK806_13150 [Bacteroidia bacterium]|nr:hypothetical protein [Bacteroidia bacterium]